MAGSYAHVRPVNRDEDHNHGAWSLIENMGDAAECVEQLLWLVFYFAQQSGQMSLLDADKEIERVLDKVYYPMARGEKRKTAAYEAVERVMNNHLPIDLDTAHARRATTYYAAHQEKQAEEKIRAIVRDEMAKVK